MKMLRKKIAVLAASLAMLAVSVTAYADEMPPGPFAGLFSATPADSVVAAETQAAPVFSMEDYQEMNDNLGVPTLRENNSPAMGMRYGSGLVIGAMLGVNEVAVPTAAAAESVTIPPQQNPLTGVGDTAAPLWTAALLLGAASLVLLTGKKHRPK